MDSKQCAACRQKFQNCPQVHQQRYCSAPKCQRERRRHWQQAKREKDPDYKDNQSRAQQAWNKRNPNYWREYRRTRPKYRERNRLLQLKRNSKRGAAPIAKMDQPETNSPLFSGVYRLIPVAGAAVAKMDAWTVEIRFLSKS